MPERSKSNKIKGFNMFLLENHSNSHSSHQLCVGFIVNFQKQYKIIQNLPYHEQNCLLFSSVDNKCEPNCDLGSIKLVNLITGIFSSICFGSYFNVLS